MSDKPAHHKIAEVVLKKVGPATRKRLGLTAKGSYTIVTDETGWVARITGKVVEFNKKRVQAKALADAGMVVEGKDEFHRLHSVVVSDGGAVAASDKAELIKDGKEGVKIGADEIAKAVGAAAKPVPVKKAPAKAEAKSKGKAAKGKAAKAKPTAEEKATADEAKQKVEQEARAAEAVTA